jgi:cytidine deaminase
MVERILQYKIYEFAFNELPGSDRGLLIAARTASKNAYAPYSGYHVGAAVLLENGEIVTGNNQENAAYPSGLCAERTALFYASAKYPKMAIRALAVTTLGNGSSMTDVAKPCGACRQVIAEYEDIAGKPIRIILDGTEKITITEGVDALLPLRFKKLDLKKD